MRFSVVRNGWKLPGLLHENSLVLCGESEENILVMIGYFLKNKKK